MTLHLCHHHVFGVGATGAGELLIAPGAIFGKYRVANPELGVGKLANAGRAPGIRRA
jgi:hypothetical protein